MIYTKNLQNLSKHDSYPFILVLFITLLLPAPSLIFFSVDSHINTKTYVISNKVQTRPQTDKLFVTNEKNSIAPVSPLEKSYINSIATKMYSPEDVFDGHNLILFEQENRTDNSDKNALLLVTDMTGDFIASKEVIKGNYLLADYSFELINSTTILLKMGSNLTLWNYDTDFFQTLFTLEKGHHHDFEYNPFTNTILTLKKVYTTLSNGTRYRFDEIVEYNTKGDAVWSLDMRTFIPLSHWCPYRDMLGKTADVTHANSLFWDVDNDIIFLNLRNTNTFYKIDHKTEKVIWGLGEHGNFSLFDKSGNKESSLFFHAHSIEKIDRNTFILFDNDFHNQNNRLSQQSRILEIKINEETMIANEVWSWIAPKEYYSSYWGDADRLPNGNRLGTFGTKTHPNTHIGARAVEINEQGDIVWELYFENNDEFSYGIYRVDRLRFSPIFTDDEEIVIPEEEENLTIQLQTWYNFRSKRKIKGSYTIFLDEKEMESGVHTFDKFWRPTPLRFESEPLIKGNHNLTIILQDEGGHSTIKSINVLVGVQNTTDRVLINIIHVSLGLFCITIIFRIHRKNNRKYP